MVGLKSKTKFKNFAKVLGHLNYLFYCPTPHAMLFFDATNTASELKILSGFREIILRDNFSFQAFHTLLKVCGKCKNDCLVWCPNYLRKTVIIEMP